MPSAYPQLRKLLQTFSSLQVPTNYSINASNFSQSGPVNLNASIAWSVDLRRVSMISDEKTATNLSSPPLVRKIANLLPFQQPHGQCLLPSFNNSILIGDVGSGEVYRLNTLTGSYEVVIDNPYTAFYVTPRFSAGVNGIHVVKHTLYFINSGLGIFAKIPVHKDGTQAGNVTILSTAREGDNYDDFAIHGHHAYLVTGSGNSVEKISLYGNGRGNETRRIVAGSRNSADIARPTSVAVGRGKGGRDTLYVVTSGGLGFPVIVNGEERRVGGQVA